MTGSNRKLIHGKRAGEGVLELPNPEECGLWGQRAFQPRQRGSPGEEGGSRGGEGATSHGPDSPVLGTVPGTHGRSANTVLNQVLPPARG